MLFRSPPPPPTHPPTHLRRSVSRTVAPPDPPRPVRSPDPWPSAHLRHITRLATPADAGDSNVSQPLAAPTPGRAPSTHISGLPADLQVRLGRHPGRDPPCAALFNCHAAWARSGRSHCARRHSAVRPRSETSSLVSAGGTMPSPDPARCTPTRPHLSSWHPSHCKDVLN